MQASKLVLLFDRRVEKIDPSIYAADCNMRLLPIKRKLLFEFGGIVAHLGKKGKNI